MALQDQGPELQRFSVSLSNNTAEKHSPRADGTSMQKQESGCSVEDLCKHNSALTWSERQQLRRTSAAMRHASASRQLPHQEHRIPPGLLPTLLLLLLWLSVSITLSTTLSNLIIHLQSVSRFTASDCSRHTYAVLPKISSITSRTEL